MIVEVVTGQLAICNSSATVLKAKRRSSIKLISSTVDVATNFIVVEVSVLDTYTSPSRVLQKKYS